MINIELQHRGVPAFCWFCNNHNMKSSLGEDVNIIIIILKNIRNSVIDFNTLYIGIRYFYSCTFAMVKISS